MVDLPRLHPPLLSLLFSIFRPEYFFSVLESSAINDISADEALDPRLVIEI